MSEQERNLRIVKVIAALVVLGVIVTGALLYVGAEVPPYDLRTYYTSASGYASPPRPGVVPVGTVARGALALKDGGGQQSAVSGQSSGSGSIPPGLGGREPNAQGPTPIADLRNPLHPEAETLGLGERAYGVNCAMCHGEGGRGIGPVGKVYQPRPPDLSKRLPGQPDGRLYIQITEGIRSTPTPEAARYLPREWHAFREITTPRERWAILTYLKARLSGGG